MTAKDLVPRLAHKYARDKVREEMQPFYDMSKERRETQHPWPTISDAQLKSYVKHRTGLVATLSQVVLDTRAALSNKPDELIEMRLCEQEHLLLKPNQLYRFTAAPGCARCAELDRGTNELDPP